MKDIVKLIKMPFLFIRKRLFFSKKDNEKILSLLNDLNGRKSSLSEDLPEIITIYSKNIFDFIEIIGKKNSIIESKDREIIELTLSNSIKFGDIAHNFKTPFNSAMGFVSLLKESYQGNEMSDQKMMIDKIDAGIQALNEKLSYMLAFHKANNNVGLSLIEIVELARKFYSIVLEDKKLDLSIDLIDNKSPLNIPTLDLMIIIDNLLDNAIKFSDKNTKIKFSFEYDLRSCYISISNIGIIYSSKKQVGTGGEKGTGTGLLRIKSLLEKNNSQLQIQSEGKKTTISFVLSLVD